MKPFYERAEEPRRRVDFVTDPAEFEVHSWGSASGWGGCAAAVACCSEQGTNLPLYQPYPCLRTRLTQNIKKKVLDAPRSRAETDCGEYCGHTAGVGDLWCTWLLSNTRIW